MRFVVQHHRASADHYDVRLEIDGVLVSWAVPKGPSADPQVRRMAVRVDDHEMTHADVEGHFGDRPDRGVVQVWDHGTWSLRGGTTDAARALRDGHLSFSLDGQKLHGGWSLIRLPDEQRETWLLIKKADGDAEPASDITADRPRSVLSGRTMHEIAAGR